MHFFRFEYSCLDYCFQQPEDEEQEHLSSKSITDHLLFSRGWFFSEQQQDHETGY